jgi:uncharacterized protein
MRRVFRCSALALAAALTLVACGTSHRSTTPTFPSTPAGAQARWLFGAAQHLPIPAAVVRTHFDQAFLARVTPDRLNSTLAGADHLRLVSIASSQKEQLVGVVSVSGGVRFEFTLIVDSHGMIAALTLRSRAPTPSSSSDVPPLAPGWVAQPVTFDAGGITIYGTYTHPGRAKPQQVPGAVLIAGSGSVDRNENEPGLQLNSFAAVANWLAADGVATLRYDKLGSGQTGAGPYAAHPEHVGIKPFEQEAAAALNFLARQPSIDRSRLAIVGHSEGAQYALLLATGIAGRAPKVHALILLEPQSIRILDVIREQITAQIAAAQKAGQITAAQAQSMSRALARQITSLRTTGRFAAGVPPWLATTFNSSTQLYLYQQDRYDPAAEAAKLTPRTPVLLTCSDADIQVSCADVDHLAAGLSHAHVDIDFVHLHGVDHVLKEDGSRTGASYTKPLPFSTQLRSALQAFAVQSL